MQASVPLVTLLLSLGADPKEPSLSSRYGGSVLDALASSTYIHSSEDELVEVAKLLIESGADLNFQDPDTKSTPLLNAVLLLKPKLVREFLSRGANPLPEKMRVLTPYLGILMNNYSWTSVDTLAEVIGRVPEILLHVFNPSDWKTNFFHILSEAPEMARDDGISAKICKMLVSKLKETRSFQRARSY